MKDNLHELKRLVKELKEQLPFNITDVNGVSEIGFEVHSKLQVMKDILEGIPDGLLKDNTGTVTITIENVKSSDLSWLIEGLVNIAADVIKPRDIGNGLNAVEVEFKSFSYLGCCKTEIAEYLGILGMTTFNNLLSNTYSKRNTGKYLVISNYGQRGSLWQAVNSNWQQTKTITIHNKEE